MDNILMKGIISGYVGALVVYPIDLIKTRVQNTKINGYECFKLIIKNEGYKAFYKGLFVQVIGIGPEKAIKIATNEFISNHLIESNINKIIAGSCAGAAQVIVSNPIEIVKIQYQINKGKNKTLFETIKDLGGIKNLYKGASACLLRDIPFSAIYFPTYDYLKNITNNTFVAGMLAGVPSAYISTPADVIKTRYQIVGNNYKNLIECTVDIYKKEGLNAFFRGGFWRVLKSAPQFGITLFVYENL